MSQLKETEDIFLGRLVWAAQTEWAKDNDASNGEWFRLWEELTEAEQSRCSRIGVGLVTYFRGSEGNAFLKSELARVKKQFDQAMTSIRKEHKERGGR